MFPYLMFSALFSMAFRYINIRKMTSFYCEPIFPFTIFGVVQKYERAIRKMAKLLLENNITEYNKIKQRY